MQLIERVPQVEGNDGGLELRQMLRSVKDRMETKEFKRSGKMGCGACNAGQVKNPRSYRTWESLRDHLITYHGADRREVPE